MRRNRPGYGTAAHRRRRRKCTPCASEPTSSSARTLRSTPMSRTSSVAAAWMDGWRR